MPPALNNIGGSPERRIGVELRRVENHRILRSLEGSARTRGVAVRERQALVEEGSGNGPVEKTRIEMRQAVMDGQALSERSLAGGGRPVDRNDHGADPGPK